MHKKSWQSAQQYSLKEQISDANLKLSELYERAGSLDESFKYYKTPHCIQGQRE